MYKERFKQDIIKCRWVTYMADIQTSAGRLSLVPLGIIGDDAFNGYRSLFQSVARVTGKLHDSSHCPSVVATGQVTVFHKRLVAVARCKGCSTKTFSELEETQLVPKSK